MRFSRAKFIGVIMIAHGLYNLITGTGDVTVSATQIQTGFGIVFLRSAISNK